MSLTKSWYTFDEAVFKFGISFQQLNQWVDGGLIRTEKREGAVIMVNGDDIEQELCMVPSV